MRPESPNHEHLLQYRSEESFVLLSSITKATSSLKPEPSVSKLSSVSSSTAAVLVEAAVELERLPAGELSSLSYSTAGLEFAGIGVEVTAIDALVAGVEVGQAVNCASAAEVESE